MKYFTHPEGLFEIQIPLDWHYKNEVLNYENLNPFSFELFENAEGCFQISCYNKNERGLKDSGNSQKYNVSNLKFKKTMLPDEEFEVTLWGTYVEDLFIMIKYICQPSTENLNLIKEEKAKVEVVLKTLMCLSPDRRPFAIGFDRFEKFNGSLAASFDLKHNAMKHKSLIELVIISANQIDAYLRLCIVLKLQIIENTSLFKLEYLFQGSTDKAIMEKKIYDKALEMGIISKDLLDKLNSLYNERSKVVHRYIITDIKTIDLYDISYKYEILCEEVRLVLEKIELEQFESKIGYHSSKHPHRQKNENYKMELFSLVNDKHFVQEFYRDIKKSN